jgi:hypothetical protein
MFCWRRIDLHKAVAILMNNEDKRYVKKMLIRILRDYAKRTDNLIDDALVDQVEQCLFPPLP